MAHVSVARRRTRQEISRLAGLGLQPELLAASVMNVIERVVPGDGYRFFALDPVTRLVTRLLAASADDGWARLEWLRDWYLQTDPISYIEHHQLTRLKLTAVAVQPRQDECWGYRDSVLSHVPPSTHQRAFHELQSPVGGAILAQITVRGQWIAALQLYRRDRSTSFTPDDVEFVQQMLPLIGDALSASLAREQAMAARDNDEDASGVLLLDPRLRITLCTPAAESWLARLYDSDRDNHAPLPTAVWSAIAAMRAQAEIPVSSIVMSTQHGALRVEASAAGPDGTIAVVLAPERPLAEPRLPDGWNLTRQEQRVLELLVRGHSNREISECLYVSENTVEYHLRHAYEKIGVRSRSQALARFFQETWPLGAEDQHQTRLPRSR